jgi:hypothetical protein
MDALESRVFLTLTPASPRPETLGALFDRGERQVLLDRLSALPGTTRANLQGHLDASNVGAFDSALRIHLQTRSSPDFHFAPSAAAGIAQYIAGTLGDGDASARADKIVEERKFPADTSTDQFTVTLPADVNWVSPGTSPTPDFIHALNRQQFWLDLHQAYLASGDTKYVGEIMYQLADWSSEFASLATPSAWSAADRSGWLLDTSVRAENFTWTLFTLLNDGGFSNASVSLLLYKLVQHGDFLYSNAVSTADLASNRTLTLAKGLHYLGVLLPEADNAALWSDTARDLLFRTMDAQFYPDGAHVEQSPGYTVGAVEDLLEAKRLDQLNGFAWPSDRSVRLSNAIGSYWQLLSPNGARPALGDTYRITSVTLFLKANQIQGVTTWPEAKPRPRDAWLFGTSLVGDKLSNPVTPALGNRGKNYAMPTGGYYVARSDNSASATQLIFDAGPKGGFHGHADQLAFELFSGGRPLVKDPGPYRYDTSADRAYVISTRAHNTVNIDGANQGSLEGANNPGLEVSQYSVTGSSMHVTATTRGYQYLPGRPVHTRSLWYDLDGTMLIVDWVESGKSHAVQQSFNLPAGADAATTGVQGDGSFRTRFASGDNVQISPLSRPGQTVARGGLTFTTDTPSGDYKEDAYRFTVTQSGTFTVFATLINTYSGTTPPATTATLLTANPAPGQPVQIRLSSGGSDETINFTPPTLERLDASATSRGTDNDLAFDPAGRLHLAYFDRDARELKYTVREADGTWTIPQTVDAGLDAGLYPSIDVAPNGTIGIAYFDGQNGDLQYASLATVSNAWETQTIDSVGSVGLYPSLKFSRNSGAVIAYYHRSRGQLRLAVTQTSGFEIQVLDGSTTAAGDVGRFASLQLDPNRPTASKWAIVYEDTRKGKYKYTIQQGSGWSTAVIDPSLQLAGGYASLAFYDTGGADPATRYRPAASYYDAGETALKYSHFNGSNWVPQIVAAAKIQGLYTNLFFTGAAGSQRPTIYYYDRSNNLAKRVVGASAAGGWTYTNLGAGGRALQVASFGSSVFYSTLDEAVGELKVLVG